ncbi:MAG: hypothetical protein GX100_13125, partial [candidate division WS1 bacterium]|nr:hypothetical protein [candidate division WS1 bacterium]
MAASRLKILEATQPAESRVTLWGPGLGILLSVLLNLIAGFGYARFPDQQGFTDSFATIGALCLLFFICWPLAGLVYKLTHRLLTTADKALIYFCLMLATV